jgi:hypothetical protein
VSRSYTNINTKIANVGVHFWSQQNGDYRGIPANYYWTLVHGTGLKIVYLVMYDTIYLDVLYLQTSAISQYKPK